MPRRYANRLLGLASAFLASVITSRAFLIAWPGEEAVQLHNFFRSDLIDWKVTDDVMERLGIPQNLEFPPYDWAHHDILQLLNGEHGEIIMVPAEKAEFRDIFTHGHHAEEVARLGLSHPDEAMSLLALVLQPSGALADAVRAVHASTSPCHMVGIQVRIAEEARSMLQCSGGSKWPRTIAPHRDKEFLTMDDLPRYAEAALHLERQATSPFSSRFFLSLLQRPLREGRRAVGRVSGCS